MKKLLLKIRHWVEYILFKYLLIIFTYIGLDRASLFGSFIGRYIGKSLPFTNIARRNLKSAMPELSEQDIQHIINGLWDNYGRFIGEFPHTHLLSEEEIHKHIKINGQHHLKKLKGKPYIICAGHFANWDFVLSKLSNQEKKLGVIYRPANNPYVDKEIRKMRSLPGVTLIEKGRKGAGALARIIKSKTPIIMLSDQKMNEGIAVPLFNKPAMTAPAVAKISLKYKYPILMAQIVRKSGANFEINITPLKYQKTDNEEQDIKDIMTQINNYFESWARENPSQWFWFHKRW